ncbi:3-hydroxyacyl-CoA dehydrogenase [Oleiphilus messinensis]|uniref:3-hydroxyacyl-CoA dehydrogenase n=1 Tax=Oleiphilus messinensis TaxID=141451 RepID=A0A1Y0IFT5_9GAMM|nr:3-hydroxyacyl-CoA dehydrogenase [Oleiphilus messinensis]ARU59331.1 3-hydroxyacyl-CoA dehydrogenase [Oleiphilus messinensis]
MTDKHPLTSPKAIQTIRSVGIIGAGTMGRGIAMSFLNAGFLVQLIDMSQETLAQAESDIRKTTERLVSKGKIATEEAEKRLNNLQIQTEYDSLSSADLVIEAVYENLELKQQIFRTLDEVTHDTALLASNTSYLDIDAIAAVTRRPEQVLGLHFFSPAHIMRLLEIVRGTQTAPEVIETARQLALQLKKVGVVAGNCHGFIGNRMLEPYVFEARRLLLEGALPQQVDHALEDFGMAMGPFRMYDVVGIDLEWRARQMASQQPDAGSDEALNVRLDDRLCELGRFGQKSGQGYYHYEAGDRTAIHDPAVDALVLEISRDAGFERHPIPDQTIVERCILALINEGAKILQEGIAQSSADIDTVYLNGYGFAQELGGPMQYADRQGLEWVLDRLQQFQEMHGPRWKPADLIKTLLASGHAFADYPPHSNEQPHSD